MDDAVVAVAGVAHTMGRLAAAWEGTVAEEPHSTFADFAAIAMWARHTCDCDHVPREKQPRPANLTEECGKWEDMTGASSV